MAGARTVPATRSPVSRAVTVRLDFRDRTATLVASDDQPAGLVASSRGNAQTTATGDLFVGWGNLPYFSEFSPSGRLLFNAELPAGVNSYRAYQLPWPGRAGNADCRRAAGGIRRVLAARRMPRLRPVP